MSLDKCVAIGECGLDFPDDSPHPYYEEQLRVFSEQLRAAHRIAKPVIVYLRGHRALDVGLSLCQRFLSATHTICLHNFSGNPETMRVWIRAFANVRFGFTSLYQELPEVLECMRRVELTRVLVESNAPHSTHEESTFFNNFPHSVLFTLRKFSALRNVPLSVMLYASVRNAGLFYNIPL